MTGVGVAKNGLELIVLHEPEEIVRKVSSTTLDHFRDYGTGIIKPDAGRHPADVFENGD